MFTDSNTSQASRILLTEQEAARELCTISARVKRWAKRGLLAYVELPDGEFRYRRDDLAAFAESRLVSPTDERPT